MKKFIAVVALVCFVFVPAVMAGTALVNSDEDQNFDGYTSTYIDIQGGASDSDYHSWSGSDGENHTEIGSSNAGGTAKVWGYFFEGQNSYSWSRIIFEPSSVNTKQSAYLTQSRSFECNSAAEAGNYSVIASVDVEFEAGTKNEFDGYIETEDLRIDWEADKSHLTWDKNNGESTGIVTLTLDGGKYVGGIILTTSSDIQLNETHNAVIYVNGHSEGGDDSSVDCTYNLIPLP